MPNTSSDAQFSSPPSTEELMALYEQKQKEEQKNNPMSVHYERVNIRPKLNFLRVLPLMLVTLLVSVIIALAFYFTINSLIVSILSGSIFLLIMVLVHIKYLVISLFIMI